MASTKIAILPLGSRSVQVDESISILMSSGQDQFTFESLPHYESLPVPDMQDVYSWGLMYSLMKQATNNVTAPVIIGIVSQPIEKNWFSHSDSESKAGIVSTAGWDALSDLPVHVYLANAIVHNVTSVMAPNWKGHDETRNCFGDFCEAKADIVAGIMSGHICKECTGLLMRELGQDKVDAIQSMLDAVSRSVADI